MKNSMSKIFCAVMAIAFIVVLPQQIAAAGATAMDQTRKTDHLVLSVGIGNGEGEIGYSDSMAGGGSGPEAFTVAEDGKIYICDNVNKRVNVYQNGSFSYTIATPYITYVRSIVESDGFIYLMDYDAGTIYAADTDGTLVRAVSLPDSMKSYLMKKLYIQSNGTVCLFYERNLLNSENAGVDCTYSLDDLEAGKAIGAEGFMKDADYAYRISDHALSISSLNTDVVMTSATDYANKSTQIMPDNSLTSMRILNVDDKDIVYISVYDMVDSSIVSGEYTVRKFTDGTCTGIAPVDLKPYYYMPNNVLEVSEDGKLYQMICTKDQVLIVEKAFVDSDDFKSDKSRIEAETLEKEAALESVSAQAATVSPSNTRDTARVKAVVCTNLPWTYTSDNAKNPNSSAITAPTYLTSQSKPSEQRGIPYCWGGFDGIDTKSPGASWTDFQDAISKKAFAGNIHASGGYKAGTAGYDCSGYVSSTAGFPSKLSTIDLASATYSKKINVSDRKSFDIYVWSGNHVVYFSGETTEGIKTYEATTSGDEKTKAYIRSKESINAHYQLRCFYGW